MDSPTRRKKNEETNSAYVSNVRFGPITAIRFLGAQATSTPDPAVVSLASNLKAGKLCFRLANIFVVPFGTRAEVR